MFKQVQIRVENNIYPIETILFTASPFFTNLFYNINFIEHTQEIIDLDITTEDWLSLTHFLNIIFQKTYINYINDPWNLDSYSKDSLEIDLDENQNEDENELNVSNEDNSSENTTINKKQYLPITKNSLEEYIVKLTWEQYEGLKNTLSKYLFTKLAVLLERYEIERLLHNIDEKNYQELSEGINISKITNVTEFLGRLRDEDFNVYSSKLFFV